MSIAGMRDSWQELSGGHAAFYEQVRGPLIEGTPLAIYDLDRLYPLVDSMLDRSEAIRRAAEGALSGAGGAEYVQAAELLLAVSAVDTLLASDLVVLDPETRLELRLELPRIELEEDADFGAPGTRFEEGAELIAAVERLFRDLQDVVGAGAAEPDAQAIVAEARVATADLVTMAEAPGDALARGFVVAAGLGAVPVLDVLSHLHVLDQVPKVGGGLRRRALAFVREHVAKLRELVPLDWGLSTLAMQVDARVSTRGILVRAANASVADRVVRNWVMQADPPPSLEQADALRADLISLSRDYRKHTEWLSTSTKRLRWIAGAVSHIAAGLLGPAGYCLMPAVFLVGEAYVAYSLADRLDARHLGPADRVEGVVRIVKRVI